MKFSLVSDIHCNFDEYLPEKFETKYVVIAGDIWEYPHTIKYMHKLGQKFPENVFIFVFGNHDLYMTHLNYSEQVPQELSENIWFLHNNHIVVEEDGEKICFYGGIMWTNIGDFNPMQQLNVQMGMNDFRCIKGLNIQSWQTEHNLFCENLLWTKENVEYDKLVVISHHAPSFKSVPPIFHNSKINAGYYSDKEELMNGVDVWVCGHIHSRIEYSIGKTKVYCNSRGYVGYEKIAEKFEQKVIEV